MNYDPHWTAYAYWFSGFWIVAMVMRIIAKWPTKEDADICHTCGREYYRLNVIHCNGSSARVCDECVKQLQPTTKVKA